MYMLFLLSGYFVPRSVHKKGVVRYLKERLLRIGVPLLLGLLLINSSSWLLGRLSPTSKTADVFWRDLPFSHLGVLWFLVVLFTFDLIYCAWVKLRGDHFAINTSVPTPQLRSWLISAAVLAILELVLATQKELWVFVARLPLGGLETQGSHVFTYAFLFFWLQGIIPSLAGATESSLGCAVVRFSITVALSLLAICLSLHLTAAEISGGMFRRQVLNPFIGWGMWIPTIVVPAQQEIASASGQCWS